MIGRLGREAPPVSGSADALAKRRIEAARHCRAWTELDPAGLVARERGYLVDVETDQAFRVYRGDAFSPSGAVLADQMPLAFLVDAGDVLVLERQPETWSARRAWRWSVWRRSLGGRWPKGRLCPTIPSSSC